MVSLKPKHRRIFRPWGNYISIAEDSRWQVKRIEVKPGSQLSLQMHHHRAEHWIVVKGLAKVLIDDKEFLLKKIKVLYTLGIKHRLTNWKVALSFNRGSKWDYLGEDDIVRFQDDYGRKNNFKLSKMKYFKNFLCISNFNDDLDWLKEFDNPHIIYDKCQA